MGWIALLRETRSNLHEVAKSEVTNRLGPRFVVGVVGAAEATERVRA